MEAPKFPDIPTPEASVESILRSLLMVISTLQIMTGKGPKSKSGAQTNRNMAHVFVQDTEPDALNDGDFWLCLNPKASLSSWTGERWVLLATAT